MVYLLSPPAAGWSTWFCFGRWNQEVSCSEATLLNMWGFFTNGYGIFFAWHILRKCFGNCSTLLHKLLIWYLPNSSSVHLQLVTLSWHSIHQGNQVSREVAAKAACFFGSLLCSEEFVCTFITKKYSRIKTKTLIQCDFSLPELHLEHGPHPHSSEPIQCCSRLTFHFRAKLGKLRLAVAF